MAEKADIVLTDSTQTPFDGSPGADSRTFEPQGPPVNGVHSFGNDWVGTTAALRSLLSLSHSLADANRTTNKSRAVLRLPGSKTVDGELVKANDYTIDIRVTSDKDATPDHLYDGAELGKILFNNAIWQDMIRENKGTW